MLVVSVLDAGRGFLFDVGGPTIEMLTSSHEDAYCIMRGTIPAGGWVPLHSHGDTESFYVLSGEAQFYSEPPRGPEWQTLQRGDFAHIPGGVKHGWRNSSAGSFEAIIITTPNLGQFLREFGTLVETEGRDRALQRLHELSGRYGYWNASPEENAAVGIPSHT